MKSSVKILEEDMYGPIRDFFMQCGYQVNSEVNHCDVTAVKDDRLIIVEMKTHLNLDVIIQAVKRQRLTDMVYVAVPKPGKELFTNKWKDIFYLLRRLELGLMLVTVKTGMPRVDIVIEPTAFDREKSKKISSKKKAGLIKEISSRHGDFNKGGSTRKKLVTAYKEKAIHIACLLEINGPLKPKQLRAMGTDAKKTTSIVYDNHYGWFERNEDGTYYINDKAAQEIHEYSELYHYYRENSSPPHLE